MAPAALTYARDGHDNNFHLIRHLAALAVVLSHSYAVTTGRYEAEPLVSWLGQSLGHYAVDVFFVLSGFLVTQSLARDGDLLRYLVSRVMRIFPALIVAVLLTALLLGPMVSTLPLADYFGDERLRTYLFGALTTTATDTPLPDVFTTLPEAGLVNVPLWTLKYELAAYLSLGTIAALSAMFGRQVFLPLTALGMAALYAIGRGHAPWPESEGFASNAIHLLTTFYIGAAAYLARRYVPLSPVVVAALFGLAVLAYPTVARELAEKMLIAYTVLWLAFLPGPRNLERFGDASYGIYILAFPIQQTIFLLSPGIDPLTLFVLAVGVTVPLAMLCWRGVEAPSLRFRSRIVTALRSLRPASEQAKTAT